MKYSKMVSGFVASIYIAISMVALLPAPTASALYGATQPTKCGTVRGYTKITNVDESGKVIRTVDSAAKYYTSQAPGAKNECVKDIQRMLNASYCTSGTRLVVDGSYGSRTTTAITKMQRYLSGYNLRINGAKIIVDGKVGPQTWSLLSTSKIDARFNPCR